MAVHLRTYANESDYLEEKKLLPLHTVAYCKDTKKTYYDTRFFEMTILSSTNTNLNIYFTEQDYTNNLISDTVTLTAGVRKTYRVEHEVYRINITKLKGDYTPTTLVRSIIELTLKGTLIDLHGLVCNVTSLEYLDISELNTSLANNMSYAFSISSSKLTTLDLSNLFTDRVTSMDNLLSGNYNLITIGDISKWNTSQVTDFTSAFSGCSSLTSIDASSLVTKACTDLTYMFYDCSSLTNIKNIEYWDTSNVTSMYGLFIFCSKLSSLNISDWDTSKVTLFSSMLYSNNVLKNLDLSKWNISSAKHLDSMFKDCEGLKTVGKLDNWNTSNVLEMSSLFFLDENLEDVGDLSNWNVSKVQNMSLMFAGTTKLKSIGDISNWNTSNVFTMASLFKDSGINDLNVDNWDTSKVGDISYMFFNCATPEFNLSNWNLSRCTTMSYMFGRPRGNQGYNPIRKVGNIGRWDTSKVTTINNMFQYARDLEKLDLSGWNMSECTNMSWAFCGLYQWTGSLVLNWSTIELMNLRETFKDTYNLTEINISTWYFSRVSDIYRCFSTSPNYWSLNNNATGDTYPDGTRRMKLVNLYLGKFDMSSVNLTRYGSRSDYQVFIGCANLKHIFLNANSTSGFEFLKTQLVYDTDYSGGPTIASHCKIHKGSDVYSYNGSTWVKQ